MQYGGLYGARHVGEPKLQVVQDGLRKGRHAGVTWWREAGESRGVSGRATAHPACRAHEQTTPHQPNPNPTRPTQEVELVAEPPLPVKLHPVVHPAIGLRGGADGVVHRKAKLARGGIGVLRGGGARAVSWRGVALPSWRPQPSPHAPAHAPRPRRTAGGARCIAATARPRASWSGEPPSRRSSITMNAPRPAGSAPTWNTSGTRTDRVAGRGGEAGGAGGRGREAGRGRLHWAHCTTARESRGRHGRQQPTSRRRHLPPAQIPPPHLPWR